jgi:O-antigen/teichoic acid export membrane protein
MESENHFAVETAEETFSAEEGEAELLRLRVTAVPAIPPVLGDVACTFTSPRVASWIVRGGSSVVQQAFFGGAHFVASVLLARWLPAEEYGAFAVAYSVFLLLLMTYSAVFCEPVMVYGAGRYAEVLSAYLRAMLRGHFLLLVPAGILLALATPLIGRFYTHNVQAAFLVLSLLSPLLLLVWLCRAAFYAQLDPYTGALAGLCYFVLLTSFICILNLSGMLSPVSAVAAMAAASMLVSAGCLRRFAKQASKPTTPAEITCAGVMSEQWQYGRWAALSAIAGWIAANIFYLTLPARYGVESTGALRVLMNLMYPLLQSESAVIVLLIPVLVRQLKRAGMHELKQTTLRLIALFVPMGLLYLVFLGLFGGRVLRLLYAGRYSGLSIWAMVAVGLLPITTGIVGLLGAAARAIELPRLTSWGALASAGTALLVGVPLTLHYGVTAAAFALVLNDIPAIAVVGVLLMRTHTSAGAMA